MREPETQFSLALMQKRLTQLAGLIDFEAAARHGSFRPAASELHKTPSAVSQQVKQLEQTLGLSLFVRHARRISLTPAGQELAREVRQALDGLNQTLNRLRASEDPALVRFSTTHSLALKWLVPRLHRFSDAHPAIDLRIDASDHPAPLDDGSCDLALRHVPADGGDGWLEQCVVAYSPALPGRCDDWRSLLRQPLLHEDDPSDWAQLLAREAVAAPPHLDLSRAYSHAGLLVQATVAAQGVGLLPFAMAEHDLERGRLQRFPCEPMTSGWAYRLLIGTARQAQPAVQAFAAWLRAELDATEAALRASAGRLTPAGRGRTRSR